MPDLPLEKELTIQQFEYLVRNTQMTTEEAKQLLIDLFRLKVISDVQYQALIRKYMLNIEE